MRNSYWDLYYRGFAGRWADLFKANDISKIESSLFKEYLKTKFEMKAIVEKMNNLEEEISKKYPLIKLISNSHDLEENKLLLEEIIVYINSKKT